MKRSATAKWGCWIPVVFLLFLPFSGYVAREVRTSEGRKSLPSSAENVQEHLTHGWVGGDFSRLLRCQLPEEHYLAYAKSLGLSRRFDPQNDHELESKLNMRTDGAPAWWNPPAVDASTYFEYEEGDDYLRVLRYHSGHAYYFVISW